MMRRSTRRVISAAAALAAVALAVWGVKTLFRPVEPGETLMAFLPKDASIGPLMGAVGLNHLDKIYTGIEDSNFISSLVESELYRSIFSEPRIESSEGLPSYIPENIPLEKIRSLVGRQAAAALYGSQARGIGYLLVSQINDRTGIKQLIYSLSRNDENAVSEHREAIIEQYGEGGYFTVTDGYLIAGSSLELIREAVELVKGERAQRSIHAAHPWMEEKLNHSSDGFAIVSYRDIAPVLKALPAGSFRSGYTVHEFFIDRGLHTRTFVPAPDAGAPRGRIRAEAISLIPSQPILAGVTFNADFKKEYEKLTSGFAVPPLSGSDSRKGGIDFEKDILPLLGSQFGYSLQGPSDENIGHALPVFMAIAEARDRKSLEELYGLAGEILQVEMHPRSHGGEEYKKAEFPVFFGQRVEVCAVPVALRGKHFLVLTTSSRLAEEVIDIAANRARGLGDSPAWKEISSFFPSGHSTVSYSDLNALAGTVGLFYASVRGDRSLRDLIAAGPFSWAGPTGSATVLSEGFRISHSYLPVQDLSPEKWKNILDALKNLIF